ncbi:hypothetical protein GLOTRDRAFT_130387 [Gloeophyllum trabeum ATCC 11539]|uniref:Uncharacterized protein n=1 Tax=Gloeophyllum trabeum (strain ATCC 11539 / FP-39264 / Madison 617) TaxID=670483 RepID=S7Q1X3_GLOTA|nr:uncharacterized protein GLOTRDRAFT_130387 [Gloeophyllum trabeum ATCC 11539]EPQ53996.1 hypothetical protein GLOTRDRAFT_130387 [Gloeophyllum trabeum ATCC 11539]
MALHGWQTLFKMWDPRTDSEYSSARRLNGDLAGMAKAMVDNIVKAYEAWVEEKRKKQADPSNSLLEYSDWVEDERCLPTGPKPILKPIPIPERPSPPEVIPTSGWPRFEWNLLPERSQVTPSSLSPLASISSEESQEPAEPTAGVGVETIFAATYLFQSRPIPEGGDMAAPPVDGTHATRKEHKMRRRWQHFRRSSANFQRSSRVDSAFRNFSWAGARFP